MQRNKLFGLTRATILVVVSIAFSPSPLLLADVFRWDNGALIPGTEGITPGPGVQLNDKQLDFANLGNKTLSDASFARSALTSATFQGSTLTRAVFSVVHRRTQ